MKHLIALLVICLGITTYCAYYGMTHNANGIETELAAKNDTIQMLRQKLHDKVMEKKPAVVEARDSVAEKVVKTMEELKRQQRILFREVKSLNEYLYD